MKLPEIDLEELEKLKEQNFREKAWISGQICALVKGDRQHKSGVQLKKQ